MQDALTTKPAAPASGNGAMNASREPAAASPPAVAVIDRRVIAFRSAALAAAIESTGRALDFLPITAGKVTEVLPSPASQAIEFRFEIGGQTETRHLGSSQLAALLIAYCISVGIPLPTRSTKGVTIVAGGVVLDFVTTMQTPPRLARR